MKSIYKVLITVAVIISGVFFFLPIKQHELEKLRNEKKQIQDEYDSLEIKKTQQDSLIAKMLKAENKKVDSLKKTYSKKYKDLRNEYKDKINDVNEFDIDSNIKLFSDLISQKDSIK